MTSTDQLGAIGEAFLRQLAAEADITANKADPDRHGWDFLLEWDEKPLLASMPLDLRAPSRKAFVQVKATEKNGQSTAIRLGAWRKLVDNPLPVFFLVCCVVDLKVVGARLVHLWEDQIASVLKRLREHSHAKLAEETINHLTLVLPHGRPRRFQPLAGAELRRQLNVAIADYLSYPERKRHIRDSVGYRALGPEFRFSVTLPSHYESPSQLFVDASLGLTTIDVEQAQILSTRFDLATPVLTMPTGKLQINPSPPIPALLEFSTPREGVALRLHAQAHRSMVGGPIDPSEAKVRFTASPYFAFELVFADRPSKFRLSFPDTTCSVWLPDAAIPAFILGLLSWCQVSKQLPSMTASIEGLPPIGFTAENLSNIAPPKELLLWASLIRDGYECARKLGLEGSEITPVELAEWRSELQLAAHLIRHEQAGLRSLIWSFKPSLDLELEHEHCCITTTIHLDIAQKSALLAFGQFTDHPERQPNGRWQAQPHSCSFHAGVMVAEDQLEAKSRELLDEMEIKWGSEFDILELPHPLAAPSD